jgi:N6-adenosine-specific RNA methylase IME4
MKNYPIHEAANVLPLLPEKELQDLADNIRRHGLEVPITVCRGLIVDGRNRLMACQLAGVEPRFEERNDIEDIAMWVWSLNGERRHLQSQEQKVLIWRKLHMMSEEVQAKLKAVKDAERKAKAEAQRGNDNACKSETKVVQSGLLPENQPRDRNKSRAVIADAAKVSKTAVARAEALVKAAPELADKVASGEMRFSDAVRESKRAEVIAKLEDVSAREVKAAEGVYDVIVIDPPWPMEKIERDVTPNQVAFEYPTMQEAELAEMKMPAAEDCHLWLWTTHKFLPMALRLLSNWQFKYVCTFVWHKPGGFQPFGLPQYNCEFAIYARKGTPQFIDTKAFPVCFNAPRGAHSEKPEEFYDVVRRVTAGRRIDIFNRRKIEGFDTWGKEAAE